MPLLAGLGALACVQAFEVPDPGMQASDIQTRLGAPSTVVTEPEEFRREIEWVRECKEIDTTQIEQIWLYLRHNHRILTIAFNRDASVVCAGNHGVTFVQQ